MKPPLHVPTATGRDALDDLDRVPWEYLQNAYGKGSGAGDHADVRGALAQLGDEDDPEGIEDGVDGLFGNVCHQGTIYEVTAYAVPFLAAFTAGLDPDDDETYDGRAAVVALLAHVGWAASHDAPHGSHAGSWGEGVGEATRAAFGASASHLRTIAERDRTFRPLASALEELARSSTPSEALVAKLHDLAFE